ncbi:HEPN domain-containing protein [Methanobrevibacter filiformis]|uniref:HEPN domain protein n=1 Tax=Methanobrevibacter filiformis TaxID=55758 RepID=A0A166CK41_9EURY|nr:HEPN domain-containing protein [Methanobrevibacter filiformis]KZX14947.1 HEPN domain protein [Methanobrevibacter filiformis]
MDERVKIAFDKSQELLKVSELTFNNGFYSDSINRPYYAVFHAANALLMKKRIFAKSHSGTIRQFGLEYVINDNFDKIIGKFFHNIEQDREHADYDYSFESTKNKAKIDLDHAKRFVEECKKFL